MNLRPRLPGRGATLGASSSAMVTQLTEAGSVVLAEVGSGLGVERSSKGSRDRRPLFVCSQRQPRILLLPPGVKIVTRGHV